MITYAYAGEDRQTVIYSYLSGSDEVGISCYEAKEEVFHISIPREDFEKIIKNLQKDFKETEE